MTAFAKRCLARLTGCGFLAALAVLFTPSSIYSQSCAMCYQSAARSGPRFIQALRHGILVMLFPPLLIMGAILYAAYRKRDQFNSTGRFDEEIPLSD
jgi:hypothetical protein